MVLLIIIPIKWLFHWEYTLFSDKPISQGKKMYVEKVDHSRDCLSMTNPTKCLMVRSMEHTIPSLGLKY